MCVFFTTSQSERKKAQADWKQTASGDFWGRSFPVRILRVNGRSVCNGYCDLRLVHVGSESTCLSCPCLSYGLQQPRSRGCLSSSLCPPCLQSRPKSRLTVEWSRLWDPRRLCRCVICLGLRWFNWSLGFRNVTDHIPFGCLSHLLITYLMHTKCQGLCFDILQENPNSLYQFQYWHLSLSPSSYTCDLM